MTETRPRGLRFSELSRLGLGTHLGGGAEDDRRYRRTVRAAVTAGLNVIDTAINYRQQRSERVVGKAIADLAKDGMPRRSVFVSTKGGYLSGDARFRGSVEQWVDRTFVAPGILEDPGTLVAGCHCLEPRYLRHQLGTSLRNLGLGFVDLYYLHNPEQQLDELPRAEVERRLQRAFEFLETAADEGLIRAYGLATWVGFRVPPRSRVHLDLARLVGLAREVGGTAHRFRAIQAPFNATMPEIARGRNQSGRSTLSVAREHRLAVFASAPLLQGELALKRHPVAMRPDDTPAQAALRFTLEHRGVTSVVVGMRTRVHLDENLRALRASKKGR